MEFAYSLYMVLVYFNKDSSLVTHTSSDYLCINYMSVDILFIFSLSFLKIVVEEWRKTGAGQQLELISGLDF